MRPVRLIGSLIVLLALTLPMQAEPLTGEVVITTRTTVRSGPSEAYYPTSTLVPGDRVTIASVKDIPWLATKPPPAGWLAIKPPRGSFSWVNKRFLTISGATAIVDGETPVRVGSSLYGGLPNVEQARLSRGATVVLAGKEHSDVDGVWVPITPAPQEVRYIPANAVKPAPPVQTASAAPPPAPVPAHDAVGAPAPAPAPAGPDGALFAQAEQAEREGKRDEAERLYRQVVSQTRNYDLRLTCENRIHALHAGQVAAMPANAQVPNPAVAYSPRPASNIPPIPAPGYPSQPPPATVPPIRPASQYTYTPEIPVPASAQRPQANYSPSQAPAPQAPILPFGPGRLVHSARSVYSQQGFALEMSDRQLVYVTASPGVDLEQYLNRQVVVTGPVVYHQYYKQNCVVAQQVKLVP